MKIRDINQRKYDKTPIVLCIYGKKSGTSEKKDVNTQLLIRIRTFVKYLTNIFEVDMLNIEFHMKYLNIVRLERLISQVCNTYMKNTAHSSPIIIDVIFILALFVDNWKSWSKMLKEKVASVISLLKNKQIAIYVFDLRLILRLCLNHTCDAFGGLVLCICIFVPSTVSSNIDLCLDNALTMP